MRKSVLVIDTPEKCLDCNLCVLDMDGSISCYYNKREICSNVEENNSRPDWCPLKPLPEEKKEEYWRSKFSLAWIRGWNTCISKIAETSDKNER